MMMNKIIRYIFSTSGCLIVFLLIPGISYSQNQRNIPKPSGPIDFSDTVNWIIFVVIPAVIIIAFLIFRSRIKKVKQEKKERMRDKNEKQKLN
ncbi:hypothetical protein [Algoriphagus sp. Y33]|uniref:hypothetical protein n=1 Tax=Algoriphagus sp. Y33 TaxID=2772483 RepID=UPI001CE15396|nr:hypothetical protein [Algoriphagus sp. Y33]